MNEITKLTPENARKIVYGYPTKHQEGFTRFEIKEFLSKYEIDEDTFNEKLGVNTVMIIETEVVTYHCDILKGLTCVLENREQTLDEWD